MHKLLDWFFFACLGGLAVSALWLATLPHGDPWRVYAAFVAIGSLAGMAVGAVGCALAGLALAVRDAIR